MKAHSSWNATDPHQSGSRLQQNRQVLLQSVLKADENRKDLLKQNLFGNLNSASLLQKNSRIHLKRKVLLIA